MSVGSQPAEPEEDSNACGHAEKAGRYFYDQWRRIPLYSSQANRMAGNDWDSGNLELAVTELGRKSRQKKGGNI